ncbi:hypothetical protein M2459_000974 [Parabacteroides sp. PF5-5]|uniref:N-acetylmuramoyl-L-alanine amidase-like domain-containing protein n=1 Tax=unclassified Parabacteroides TaxID=2649774 RepID=UPI002476A377|nr:MULTISPECIES: N-acetylmuramoyl-L-alanine amidase-like domain-containing protein [unclassified Parabacteroides]MDH6315039.1 hypothetical protein [Parabacteroides sp. PF5-13]MDH6326436.1 hypothetical protein [Parabacteroides sp. PH5-41]MDH6334236.1 hypothetical protein [Parabacteroides sp. PF5-5]MDH6345094.1 hypothetical protein [Parabacteroides sp. PH5-46]MDH6360257.1 hypothetical protein [Parabacteroides sp. PH5-16]
MRQTILMGIYLLFACLTQGQVQLTDRIYTSPEDWAVFDRYLAAMKDKKSLPMNELVAETTKFFLGTPYVAATLEAEPEGLVVNLREMDCATLVDNVIALSRTLKETAPSFDSFCRNLQEIRYRNGKLDGYTSRLHYTSDWVYENDKRHIVQDISKEAGGSPITFSLNFMSTHPDSYKQLKATPALVGEIAKKEAEINARKNYYYIPEADIARCGNNMQSGDMVCFTTSIKGLDTSHVGFIYRDGKRLTFIHASSLEKKVIIDKATLDEYVRKGKSRTGIMLARPLAPCH